MNFLLIICIYVRIFSGTGNCNHSEEFFTNSEEVCTTPPPPAIVQDIVQEDPPDQQLSPLMTSPARDDSQSCADAKEIYCQPNQAEDQSEKQFNDDLDDFYNDLDNAGYECPDCSSIFRSEHSLRIHAVQQCTKSRQLQAQKSDVSDTELRRLTIVISKLQIVNIFSSSGAVLRLILTVLTRTTMKII